MIITIRDETQIPKINITNQIEPVIGVLAAQPTINVLVTREGLQEAVISIADETQVPKITVINEVGTSITVDNTLPVLNITVSELGERGPQGPPGESGVTEHAELTGLGNDDHPHYLTTSRADEVYIRQVDYIDGGTFN